MNNLEAKWFQNMKFQKTMFILIAVGPPFIGYLVFTLYPNLLSVYYSFLSWNGISDPVFVGLDNYKNLFHDRFIWRDLTHNLFLLIFTPLAVTLVSLFLAYLLTFKEYMEGPFYKVLFFFPNVLSVIVIGLLWSFIYDGSFGIINALLDLVGLNKGFYWLGSEGTSLPAMIPPMIWAGVGLYVIIFMNAMISIPKSLYESAILEGAGHLYRFYKITLPLINGVIWVCILFSVLAAFKGFEIILILTNGGPAGSTEVLGLYMFNLAFGDYGQLARDYGYASTIGMLLFVILLMAKLVLDKFVRKDSVEF